MKDNNEARGQLRCKNAEQVAAPDVAIRSAPPVSIVLGIEKDDVDN